MELATDPAPGPALLKIEKLETFVSQSCKATKQQLGGS
jgi:hypothetical protein